MAAQPPIAPASREAEQLSFSFSPSTPALSPSARKPKRSAAAKKTERADSVSQVKQPAPAKRVTAESLAKQQREISVSEFFAKNRRGRR